MRFTFATLLFSILIFSCHDNDDNVHLSDTGAFQRLLNVEYSHSSEGFVIDDLENSVVKLDFELYSENKGKDINKIEWYLSCKDDENQTELVLYKAISADEFELQENGLLAYSCQFHATSILNKLGLEQSSFDKYGSFILDAQIIMDDGKIFDASTTDSDLQGINGFDGLFRLEIPVLYEYSLAGEYLAKSEFVNNEFGIVQCEDAIWEGTLIIENDGDRGYQIITLNDAGEPLIDFSMGYYYACYGHQSQEQMANGDFKLVDDFGLLSIEGLNQWGEAFSFREVTVNGKDLILEITTDYGEAGKTIITREEGEWYKWLRYE